ncbi:transglutaminase-like cysteine peptidase [Pelagibacterium sp. H642]|uniref:transglutaminase-like cysteine peptidase n=1 Tax=Pelagibacterium sp. H642 TaxID=1881069 RepID=UPI002815E96A|nr:transglutaminase-like cysteine peptidase [Pelagibacterium sp. H642]WMT89090.1 transglutaminase-like cysteine peptidase [Pelagibacterium sp. H642]
MRTPSWALTTALALAAALAGLSAEAQTLHPADHAGLVPATQIVTSSATPAPLGLQIFCLREPTHCAAAPATALKMDQRLMNLLASVNYEVNAAIRPRMRSTQVWELGAQTGDCKDYAMNKRAELIARGVPAGALRLAIGLTAQGEGHAVLIVRTTVGDYVLDNLTAQILPFNQTGHTLTAISSPDPKRWNRVA